jgi:hypothetical protein
MEYTFIPKIENSSHVQVQNYSNAVSVCGHMSSVFYSSRINSEPSILLGRFATFNEM